MSQLKRYHQSSRLRELVLASLVLLLPACTGSEEQPESSRRAQPLEQCIVGWWLHVETTCTSACMGSAPNPECAKADCRQRGFTGYVADGSTYDGILSYSRISGTVSSVGPVAGRRYNVQSDGVRVVPPDRVIITACSASNSNGPYETYGRAPAALGDVLERAAKAGPEFRALPGHL